MGNVTALMSRQSLHNIAVVSFLLWCFFSSRCSPRAEVSELADVTSVVSGTTEWQRDLQIQICRCGFTENVEICS